MVRPFGPRSIERLQRLLNLPCGNTVPDCRHGLSWGWIPRHFGRTPLLHRCDEYEIEAIDNDGDSYDWDGDGYVTVRRSSMVRTFTIQCRTRIIVASIEPEPASST